MQVNEIPFFDSPYVVFEGKYWNVILHRDNQSYLGRSIVFLKSRVLEDPLTIHSDEQNELWNEILPRLRNSLKKAFNIDRVNYSHLGNAEHFVHWHVIPRYEIESTRIFAGETFVDERVGKHYAPSPTKQVAPEVMEAIASELRKHF